MGNPLREALRRNAQGQGSGSSYSGARYDRLVADWVMATMRSADQEVRGDHRTLVNRSREVCRNSPHANRYLGLVAENVIGDEGILLQSQVQLPGSTELDTDTNRKIEECWWQWGHKEHCSVDGRSSWLDVQWAAARGWARDGEALVRLVPGFRGSPYRFAVQLLDPDQLDPEFHREASKSRNAIRMGVEIDEWGRPVAYHVWDNHPAEGIRRERVSIPAEQMIHLFIQERPGQTRGIPRFAAVLRMMKMLDGLEEAEITAARLAASKGGFFQRTAESIGDVSGEREPVSMDAEPGLMEALPPGWTFQSWDPQHPTTAFPAFHKSILRAIASGIGVSYNLLAGDLEGVNLSSIRAGLLSERDAWRVLQQFFAAHLHRRVHAEQMKWAITSGQLDLPPRDMDRYGRGTWLPRGWPWINPIQDMQAAALALRLRLDTRTRLAGSQGRDWEEVLQEQKREEELAESLGMDLTTDLSRGAGGKGEGVATAPRIPASLFPSTNGNGRHGH